MESGVEYLRLRTEGPVHIHVGPDPLPSSLAPNSLVRDTLPERVDPPAVHSFVSLEDPDSRTPETVIVPFRSFFREPHPSRETELSGLFQSSDSHT